MSIGLDRQTPTTPLQFEFEPRIECICGAPLETSGRSIVKHLPQGDVRFCQCRQCGSWCQAPTVSEISLARWVDSMAYRGSPATRGAAYDNYSSDEANRISEARTRYARDLAALMPANAQVLEIGCATGSLLAVIREQGHQVFGIDLSGSFAREARSRHGIDVAVGDFLRTDSSVSAFDVVLLFGTASNLRHFRENLTKIGTLLKEGGVLVFNFPDAESRWFRWLYRERFWMFTPSVVTFMTWKGCCTALSAAGFDVVRTGTDTQQPSIRKLLHHGKLGFLNTALRAVGLGGSLLPFPLPMPSIRVVVARRRAAASGNFT